MPTLLLIENAESVSSLTLNGVMNLLLLLHEKKINDPPITPEINNNYIITLGSVDGKIMLIIEDTQN